MPSAARAWASLSIRAETSRCVGRSTVSVVAQREHFGPRVARSEAAPNVVQRQLEVVLHHALKARHSPPTPSLAAGRPHCSYIGAGARRDVVPVERQHVLGGLGDEPVA